MSEADRAAQVYMASKGLASMPTGEAPASTALATTGGGSPMDFIKMPMETAQTLATLYNKNKTVIKLAARTMGFKIPAEADAILSALGSGDTTEIQKLGLLGSQQQPQQVTAEGEPMPEPEVGQTVVTRRMAEKMYALHEDGWGTRKIAEYFTAKGSPISHATVATTINEYEADTDDRQQSRRGSLLRTLGLYGSFAGIVTIGIIIAHFVFHF